MTEEKNQAKLSRRRFLEAGSAALAVAAGVQVAQGQEQNRSADHHLDRKSVV